MPGGPWHSLLQVFDVRSHVGRNELGILADLLGKKTGDRLLEPSIQPQIHGFSSTINQLAFYSQFNTETNQVP